MVEIRKSRIVDAPLATVWAILRDFNGHGNWHPLAASSAIEDGLDAHRVSAVRRFRLPDGGQIREQLLALSDVAHSFSYCLLEAPVSLVNYVAHVQLRRVTQNDTCLWTWSASFDPPPQDRERLMRFVADEVIGEGFRAVARLLKGEGKTPAAPVSAGSGVEARAIVLTRYGGPEVLVAQKVFVANPAVGEARIRQTAIGVNFIDIYCRRGSFDLVTPPGVLGMEAVGVVESIGLGVANVRPGDRVGYACAPPGAYASVRTMRADLLIKLPVDLSDVHAASILLKGIAAGFLLHDVYAVKPGDAVLVHAAAGGVGLLLCRWAKALGARVIGTVSRDDKAEAAARAGCDEVVVASRQNVVEAVMRFTRDRGVEVVYDAVGRDTFETSLACLAIRGRLVSFGQASGNVGAYSIDKLASRSVTLSRPNYAHYTDTAAKLKSQTDRLFAALASGTLVRERPKTYALADASQAHADLEGRRTTGALVLIP